MIKAVIYTPKLTFARGLVNLLISEDVEAHLFTSKNICKNYLNNNEVDIIYICLEELESANKLGFELKSVSKKPGVNLLFHYHVEDHAALLKDESDSTENQDTQTLRAQEGGAKPEPIHSAN